MLRVYAVWGRDKRVLALLTVVWIAQVAFCAMALAFSERVSYVHFIQHSILVPTTP